MFCGCERGTGIQVISKLKQRTGKELTGSRLWKKSDGQTCDSPEEVREEILTFYQGLYQSQGYRPMDELLNFVAPRVSDAMNLDLVKDYSVEEVKKALFDMAPSKAPGIDGFTAGFYQQHWDILGDDLSMVVREFLNGGELPAGLNDTAITLIPKVRNPQKNSQYRPIALCPVLYKIAVKAIANRFRGMLDEIIGEEQSAFIPGRLITDNVLVAYESIHAIKRKCRGKNAFCAVKLDMLKAYDRVEWHYLEAMLVRLGFEDHFVRLVMKCVTSVRFAIKVNGDLLPFFYPSKGLRQGDPMSPYLFLICAQGLTSLLNNYGGAYIDRGIRVSIRLPWVNHLLFADDSLIFLKAKIHSTARLNNILRIYTGCSGQAVNQEKSSVFFSPNASPPLRASVKQNLDIHVEAFSERYLGLPTAVGRITSGTFDHIHERSHSKMQGWSERNFACDGREVLLKSIIQAIPTFSMSCFKLTKKVCKNLTSCMARYWWGSSLDKRTLHWISWEKLATPTVKGGMGFRDLQLFNLAMLGKHGWRFLTHPNSLCARVLKGKYFPNTNFQQATAPAGASATWKAIIAGRDAMDVGLIKRVGDGSTISIWTDRWIPNTMTLKPSGRQGSAILNTVSDLIDEQTGT